MGVSPRIVAGLVGVDWLFTTNGEVESWLEDPLLSVAVMIMVKDPGLAYECVSEVDEAESMSGAEPSPQLIVKEDIVPSGSVAENDMVTVCPVFVAVGESWLMVKTGGRSTIVSGTV